MLMVNLFVGYILAFFAGKLINKLKLPQILGWMLAGVIVGPSVVGFIGKDILSTPLFKIIMDFAKTIVGIMVGYSMVFKNLKEAGSGYLKIALFEMITPAILLSIIFSVVFLILNIPWQIAILVGLVSIPTAPGVNLSIISEFKAEGKFTDALRTVTGLDNVLSNIIFYSSLAIFQLVFASKVEVNVSMFNMMIMPIIIGLIFGVISSKVIKNSNDKKMELSIFLIFMIITIIVSFYIDNFVFDKPSMNFVIVGIGYSAAFVNIVSKEKFNSVKKSFHTIQDTGLMCLIFGLGLPLNPKLIPDHFLILISFILIRGIGKVFGGYIGASIAKESEIIKKNIGTMMLPAAGVA
ncbi:MAG: cation:proton antiporter, partial [Peptoniphilaceae bacterium]|nr:cation:proton antiporter [Peptoniphilaceae bacterium]